MISPELPETGAMPSSQSAVAIPQEPLGRLFVRFLRFGALAWGGPVAQIAMICAAGVWGVVSTLLL